MSDRIYPGEIKPQRHFTGHSRILQDSSYFLALGRFRMKTKLPERKPDLVGRKDKKYPPQWIYLLTPISYLLSIELIVVIAAADYNNHVFVGLIDQTVFLGDPARPAAG
jgi:hypothetical protein